ncbi:hypothetical protein JB92DRAFT_3083175 [Gautieria morchelliformis]|nr:hypothetical protein JB92DRAFT_3083175 [Gautieria morchelliformis]
MASLDAIEPASVDAARDVEIGASATKDSEEVPVNDSESRAGDEEERAKALKQIEFYFADSNLPYDRFMWTLHTANPEHWVPIATVASFKRMRPFQPKGVAWVAEALRKSESLLEVNQTGDKVRRRHEVREPKGLLERSVYAKGFGDETPSLQGEMEKFFGQYGKVNAVRMRRTEDSKRAFKGSVFCEFANFDDVKKFLEADPKPQWKGTDLLTMSKDAYCEMKIKEKGLTGKAKRGPPIRKGFNAFELNETGKEWKKKPQPQEKLGEKPESRENLEIFLEFMGTRLKVNQEDGGSVAESEVPFTKGASLQFRGCGGNVLYAEVKAPLKDHFKKPPFIQYTRGADSGLVGFDKTLSDEDITFVREHLKTINGKPVTWEVPDETAEKAFQVERAQTAARLVISNGAEQSSSGGGRGSRGGRGNRGGHRGRGGRGRGRGGGRPRGGEANDSKEAREDPVVGEKRKRTVEPDGGPDTKGQGVPVIQTSKKAKTDAKETSDGPS